MSYKRILTIQDISCFGQCSLTVALPIISACGIETAIIPSAVLSTHTGGFTGFTVRDLSDDIPGIADHWDREGIRFDAFYTGYLGSIAQIDYVMDIMERLGRGDRLRIVDPAMADNGKLYPAFDIDYVEAMKKLVGIADYVLPNITEACFLTGIEYRESYDEEYVRSLLEALTGLGARNVVLTGVGYREGKTGVVVYENGEYAYYEHRLISKGCHGTGDVYASAFVGMLVNGHPAFESAKVAADYTVRAIELTQGDEHHWYGVKFELAFDELLSHI
ncbi:MAG: pyridoxamine kinase [Coriobacteriales bacterium]|jgi:pyridoxine kinase